jgi:hypothetical protein
LCLPEQSCARLPDPLKALKTGVLRGKIACSEWSIRYNPEIKEISSDGYCDGCRNIRPAISL